MHQPRVEARGGTGERTGAGAVHTEGEIGFGFGAIDGGVGSGIQDDARGEGEHALLDIRASKIQRRAIKEVRVHTGRYGTREFVAELAVGAGDQYLHRRDPPVECGRW